MERLISLMGLFVMIGLAWLMSSHKKKVNPRIIVGGLLLQFAFAAVILRTSGGKFVFETLGYLFKNILKFVEQGSGFVFGVNADSNNPNENWPPQLVLLKSFAFGVLPTIVFFSSFMAILYHLGVMQRIVAVLAKVMQKTLGTSGAESLSSAANVFVGQTEAPLVIRPYIGSMTQSELMAVMTGGFATIAGGVLAAYVGMGIDAAHLLAASVISAPASLLIAKVIIPEVEVPKTLGNVEAKIERTSVNVIDAAATGAADGMKLAINVAAMLIAFLALVALINAVIGEYGRWFGQEWSLEAGLGYVFFPLAWVMGIESGDCRAAGQLLGQKMVINEFVAYLQMGEWMQEDSTVQISKRTQYIMTYALSGFCNFGSIGIQLGGIGGIAPERRGDLAKIGLRAMLGGTLACCMTACIAGVLL